MESPLITLISAALFLYVGFWLGLVGISGNPIYDGSVTVFVWMARIVGLGLLVVAALAWMRIRAVLPLNFALAAIATVGCTVVGVIWLVFGTMNGVLILIFAAVNGSAAGSAWRDWKGVRT